MRVPVIIQALLFIFALDAVFTFSITASIWWLVQRPPFQEFLREVAEEIAEEEREERRGLC